MPSSPVVHRLLFATVDHFTPFQLSDGQSASTAYIPALQGFQTDLFIGAASYRIPIETPSGAGEGAAILLAELARQIAPAVQQRQLGRSQTAYYQLRRIVIVALVDLLTQQCAHAPFERVLVR